MEIWDLYDVNRIKTGEKMTRGTPIPDGRYRLAVHVCIFNSRGEMLIQHRVPTKSGWANLWDLTAGGSSLSGECSAEAVERELYEELGLRVSFAERRPLFTFNFRGGFNDVYTLEMDVDPGRLRFQPEEVDGARYASLEEILEMIDKDVFIPYNKEFIRFLFSMRGRDMLMDPRP